MLSDRDLRDGAALAERAIADGVVPDALHRFQDLAERITADRGGEAFSFNESLILHRCADLAIQVGRITYALTLYRELQLRADPAGSAALAAFKRLDLAVTSGHGLVARDVYGWIATKVWREPPPDDWTDATLLTWESTLGFSRDERPTILAVMCLAVGRLHNALRKLESSRRWFERGLRHADDAADAEGRLTRLPLLHALAVHRLTVGELAACRECLDDAQAAMAAEPSGEMFRLWQQLAEIRLAMIEGSFAAALRGFVAVEEAARAHGQLQIVGRVLIARAELFALMNQLDECEDALVRAAALLEADEYAAQAAMDRVRALASWRARGFVMLQADRSAIDSTADSATAPQGPLARAFDEATVVWSGDCLTDFEIRETAIYAKLDRAPVQAAADLEDLQNAFGALPSRLIAARLQALSGLLLLRSGQPRPAARALEDARTALSAVGAAREVYQVSFLLARAYVDLGDDRAAPLLNENDERLRRLSEGLTVEQRNAFLASKFTAAEERQRVQIDGLLALKDAAAARPLWRGLRARLRYWRALHEFVAELDQEQERRAATKPPRQEQARRGWFGLVRRLLFHPWRNVTVGYVVLPDQSLMFAVRAGRIGCARVDLGRVSVEQLQRALAGEASSQSFDDRAAQMCNTLGIQAVLDDLPPRVTGLTVVADAALHLVPFCALRFRERDGATKYLVERLAVTMSPTAGGSATAVGRRPDTALVAHYGGHERPLANAPATAAQAVGVLRDGWALDCVEADRKSTCLSALPTATVFYYFGHGHFQAGDADASGLEFRGNPRNEILSLRDIDQLRFSDLEQAVILACQSGEAATYSGRWTVSLPQMLVRRGARSVLAAMWETDADVAASVSAKFLALAVTAGRAEALRQVQLELLRATVTRDPFWWAAFQVHGSGERPRRGRRR